MQLRQETRLLSVFSYSSLTDIVLLLLIFFLLSSSFVVQPGIRVQLPKAENAENVDERQLTLTLTEKGEVFLNSKSVTLQTLGRELAEAMRGTDQVVVINADRNVSLQSTVQVIDIAKTVGASRFLIATEPPDTR